MKKTSDKKLTLKRQTLRTLGTLALADVVAGGGGVIPTGRTNDSCTCPQ